MRKEREVGSLEHFTLRVMTSPARDFLRSGSV